MLIFSIQQEKKQNNKQALILNQDSFEAMTFRHLLDLYEEQVKLLMQAKK